MNNRKKPTPAQRERLLKKNLYSCCVCKEGGIGLDLHHIDRDPSNTVDENLAVLCKTDHDANHRPKSYTKFKHLDLGPEKIKEEKIKWERFAEALKKSRPDVVGVITLYGNEIEYHSATAIIQWITGEVICNKTFTFHDGPFVKLFEKAIEYIKGFSEKIQWAYFEKPFEIQYCPHCGPDIYNPGFLTLSEEEARNLAHNPQKM